jgi:hypothetical protein
LSYNPKLLSSPSSIISYPAPNFIREFMNNTNKVLGYAYNPRELYERMKKNMERELPKPLTTNNEWIANLHYSNATPPIRPGSSLMKFGSAPRYGDLVMLKEFSNFKVGSGYFITPETASLINNNKGDPMFGEIPENTYYIMFDKPSRDGKGESKLVCESLWRDNFEKMQREPIVDYREAIKAAGQYDCETYKLLQLKGVMLVQTKNCLDKK